MTPEGWDKLTAIFHAALELPASEVDGFLRLQCEGDTRLYSELREMLEQDSHSGILDHPLAPPAGSPLFAPGEIVSGRYRIIRFLARGGMGEVYEAEDLELKEGVALKTLLPEIASDGRMIARFKQEIQLSRRIAHGNVCRVFDLARHPTDGSPEATVFLTMEFLPGETLAARLDRDGGISADAALPLLAQMAEALDAAHRAGVIHRDFKPANVMLVPIPEGLRVVVTDFGLARNLVSSGETTATLTGGLMGTLDYMAPELLTGSAASMASDVYALGMVAYKMVTGSLPFASEIPLAGAILRSKAPAPSPRSLVKDLDPAFDRAIVRALDPDAAGRYTTATGFVKALRGEQVSVPKITRRRLAALVAAVLPLLVILIIWGLVQKIRGRPSAEALEWYQTGSLALRDNTYYRAVRALERSTAIDPAFSLGHARLADAFNEIDDSGQAKSQMLVALSAHSAHAASRQTDPLYIDAINRALIGDFPGAIRVYTQLASRVPESEKAQVLVDLGRAHERNDEVPKALDAYREAARLDPQNAAAHLRTAILLGGRQLKLAEAATEFDRAQSLYESLSNTEGLAEVQYQRGYLASVVRRIPEARGALENAIQLSRAISTKHQEIAALLQLSVVTYQADDASRAQQIASDAVEQARRAGMASLAARGLTNLGFAQMLKGDYAPAEAAFEEAFELAQRQQMPRNEARARFGLASLHQLQGDKAASLIEIAPAAAFYHRAGFRLEELQCLTLIARANRDLGHDGKALAAFQQQVADAQAVDDRQQLALAEQGIGSVLFENERWPEALFHFVRYYEIAKSISDRDGAGRALVDRATALWRLGRYQEAEQVLAEAETIAGAGSTTPLKALIAEAQSGMALSRGQLRKAEAQAQNVLSIGSAVPQSRASTKWIAGLALAKAGTSHDAKRLGAESVGELAALPDAFDLAEARLALAQILLANGQPQEAQKQAQSALQVLEDAGHKEAAWRAWVILGRVCGRLGETNRAIDDFKNASDRLAELGRTWDARNLETYLARPDIRDLRKSLAK
jgi:eukaryotic-like serine/threonine-protein kinase